MPTFNNEVPYACLDVTEVVGQFDDAEDSDDFTAELVLNDDEENVMSDEDYITQILAENAALKFQLTDKTARSKALKKIRDTKYRASDKGKASKKRSYENCKAQQSAYNQTPERKAAQKALRALPENKAKRAAKARERHQCTCGGTWTCADKSRHMKSKKHLDQQKIKDMEAQLVAAN